MVQEPGQGEIGSLGGQTGATAVEVEAEDQFLIGRRWVRDCDIEGRPRTGGGF